MNWLLLLTGFMAAVLVATGLDILVPIGHAISQLCEVCAVAFATAFVCLSDGV